MSRYTLRDDSAPHQIRIVFRKPPGERVPQTAVSCTCLKVLREGGARPKFRTIGFALTLQEARALYNDPGNHDQTFAPFEDEDRLKGPEGDHHSGRGSGIAEQGSWQGGLAQGQ